MDALDVFLADAQKKGLDVIVLAQIPMIKSNPVRLQRFDALNLPTKTSLDQGWRSSNQVIRKVTENYSNTTFIDFSDASFFDKAPFYKNELIYQDTHHLNEVGSKKYGNFVSNYLLNLSKDNQIEEKSKFHNFLFVTDSS